MVGYWIAIAMLSFLVLFLGIALWSAKLTLPTDFRKIGPITRGERFRDMVATLSLASLTEGNSLRVLQNGDGYFPALLQAIRSARSSVHFETYLWKSGECSHELVEAFVERARAGVEVRVLMDALGGKVSREEQRAMRDAGVELHFYNPRRPMNLGTLNTRDHRKLAVIDGRIGFTGGHCVTDEWLGNAQDRKHYRDTSIRVEGPIVTHLQGAFSENWTEATGKLLLGEHLYPKLEAKGDVCAHLAFISFGRRVSSVRVLHHLAIHSAKREILIQNPYFLPDEEATEALCAAVKRGVRVRVMMPTLQASDNPLVQHASHYGFRPILQGGCELYLYDKTLLHQKVFVIDREWCAIGSTNFDDRSFTISEEITMSIFDRGVAAELVAAFERDLAYAWRLSFEEWRGRRPSDKVADYLAWRIRAQL